MTKQRDGVSQSEPGRARAWQIKVAHSAAEWRQAKAVLGREHGLGAGREAGDRLCQLVKEDGKLVAVLVWCAAAWHLKARDETVGWDAVTRAKRLKRVVQLRRFLVLEATRGPTWPANAWARACANWSASGKPSTVIVRCWPKASATRRATRAPFTRRPTGCRPD